MLEPAVLLELALVLEPEQAVQLLLLPAEWAEGGAMLATASRH